MNNSKQEIYQKLGLVAMELLTKPYTYVKKEELAQIFLDEWFAVLSSCLDANMSKKRFEELESLVALKADEKDIIRFLGRVAETDLSYSAINAFLATFILGYNKILKQEYKEQFSNILQKYDLNSQNIEKILQENKQAFLNFK